MPSPKASILRPWGRFRPTLNKQKVIHGDRSIKEILICNEQNRNVYENKGNYYKMPGEKSDIYVEVTRILQKIAACERQFAVNGAFGTGWRRKFAAEMTPHPEEIHWAVKAAILKSTSYDSTLRGRKAFRPQVVV